MTKYYEIFYDEMDGKMTLKLEFYEKVIYV